MINKVAVFKNLYRVLRDYRIDPALYKNNGYHNRDDAKSNSKYARVGFWIGKASIPCPKFALFKKLIISNEFRLKNPCCF